MTWAGDSEWAVGPKVAAVMGHLKAAGVVSVGMLGICWGGWVVCHASAAHPEARVREGSAGIPPPRAPRCLVLHREPLWTTHDGSRERPHRPRR